MLLDHPTVPRRVLVVEDHADGREALRLLLTLFGHQVEVASDGVEGVEVGLQMRPDVAIIDLNMPRLDGYGVARQLRAALGRDIVLVACTAYDHAEARRQVAQAGFDAHLVKPLNLEELLHWLRPEVGARRE
jgi:two-component system, sensor histidine kinase